MLAVYAISILLFLVLFVLITSIEFTMDAEARHREGESLLKGSFAVRWLFLSRKVSIEKPEKKEFVDRPEKGKKSVREEEAEIEKGKKIEREKEKEIEKKKIKGIEKEKEEKIWAEKGGRTEKKVEGIEKEKEKGTGTGKGTGKGQGKGKGKEKIEKEIEETKESKKFWKKEYSYILRAFRCLSEPLFRLFSNTLNALKVKQLDADFTFGLPDPAETGMLCGVAHSLVGALHGRCSHCSVYINPVFLDPVLDFRGNTKISIKIYSLVFSFIKFILNRKTLSFTYSIIKEWIQGKLKVNSKAL